jgi:cytidylate kinase
LTASVQERAKRRFDEQIEKGLKNITLDEVQRDIEYRDNNDSSRDFAPLCKADDAIEIDTTNLSIEEVAKNIIQKIII